MSRSFCAADEEYIVTVCDGMMEREIGRYSSRRAAHKAAALAGAIIDQGTFAGREDLFPVRGKEDDPNATIAVTAAVRDADEARKRGRR